MFAVSSRFQSAVTGSHGITTLARLLTIPGDTGSDVAGRTLAVADGSVTLDATADVRGRLDLTLAEPWPTGYGVDQLVPYGSEIAVWRGVEYGNGDTERVPLGIYRITDVEQSDAPYGTLRIGGLDRMQGIVDARLLAPRQFAAGFTYGAVVSALVTEVYPSAVIEWDAGSGGTLGRAQVATEDRFAFLRELVTSLGKIMYYDHRGVLVIKAVPDPEASVLDVKSGAGGVLVSARRSLSRAGVFNAVVAQGEGADGVAPAYGVAYDDNPSSPTYWYGDYGQVPTFMSSPFITTGPQASAAAAAELTKNLGLPYAVDFTMVPNPALEPLDVVRVSYPPVLDGRSPARARELHVLDVVGIGLGSDQGMTASTRLSTASIILEDS